MNIVNNQQWLMVADSWAAVPTVAGIQMRAHGGVTAVWRNQQLQELILCRDILLVASPQSDNVGLHITLPPNQHSITGITIHVI